MSDFQKEERARSKGRECPKFTLDKDVILQRERKRELMG